MTLYLTIGFFAGAVVALALVALAYLGVQAGSRLMTPHPAPDEHRDLTPRVELRDGEVLL